ncbi:hypothetical protein SAMN05421739_105219 [Pontibacter chinhatensis]|uniref:Uncharacterized protein n=1 Tax=Pontibacter chinhatensis TaxID=1436961 RepID=A0A1I2WV76_9BACT|nr:hypothetical protein SAMN05421739_105219 [Pontibacter chinhatensis]
MLSISFVTAVLSKYKPTPAPPRRGISVHDCTPIELCSQASNSRSRLSSRGQFILTSLSVISSTLEAGAEKSQRSCESSIRSSLQISPKGRDDSRGSSYRIIPSLRVERLVHVAVPRMRQPKQSGGSFRHTARCPKARPPGLGGQKARDATRRWWELEDERMLARIACFQLREAVARKVWPKYKKHELQARAAKV